MKYYTEFIPYELAVKVKEKGMRCNVGHITYQGEPMDITPTYASVFDWLMGKGMMIRIDPICELESGWVFAYTITSDGGDYETFSEGPSVSWIDAANEAIRKALKLLAD